MVAEIWQDGDEWYAITPDEPEGIGPYDCREDAIERWMAKQGESPTPAKTHKED